MSADDLGGLLYTSDPDAVTQVLDTLHTKRQRRPLTKSDFAEQLGRHLPTLAQGWSNRTEH